MRLSETEIGAIKAAAREAFGESAVVRLFGSRVDDRLKGGDIDLHFTVPEGKQDYRATADFRWRLFDMIEEQRVDVVVQVHGRHDRAIDCIARGEGVVL